MADIINFPNVKSERNETQSNVTMTIKRSVNGFTAITNFANLTDQEFLEAMIRDAVMQEREELVRKYISQ